MEKITETVYYIPGHTNIGVIKHGENVILIDSGLDDESGKRILRALKENGLSAEALINTHSHADHCGGNKYIKERTSVEIYAPEIESAVIQAPYLEPFYLFSGADPPKDLQNRFLMAKPSEVDHVIKNEKCLLFDDVELRIIPLPGHMPKQIGIEYGNVLFCADSVFSEDVVRKYKIPFYCNIDDTRETLMFLRNSQYKFYIPSHAEPSNSVRNLVDLNLEAIENVEKCILDGFCEAKTTDRVLKDLCDHYQINIKGLQQYFLLNTAVSAYLSSLNKRGILDVGVHDNTLLWIRV